MSQLSPSRPPSRASYRASSPSPSVFEGDPVALRHQMSALKHEIRHRTAQYNQLETQLLRGPRPLPPRTPSPDLSPSFSPPPQPVSAATKLKRRSSIDVLSALAGEGSYLPLPNGRTSSKPDDIQEGVPLEFASPSQPIPSKRTGSPTRTLSRIPVSSVGHARALAEDGQSQTRRTSPLPPVDTNAANNTSFSSSTLAASTSTYPEPSSPSGRKSLGASMGGTTKVLAELQAGVQRTQTALENTKAQLRLSQRAVAQLTRQTEDLKDGRDRLRLENEGLNNVVARKERLLQELLERARKAETEASLYKTQLKAESINSKKSLRDMEMALSESTALSQKSEREYLTLRESVKSMAESWKKDVEALREEMIRKQEESKKEAEEIALKYKSLVKLVQATTSERARLESLKAEAKTNSTTFETHFKEELHSLSDVVAKSSDDIEAAGRTANNVAVELARMRRLMQTGGEPTNPLVPS